MIVFMLLIYVGLLFLLMKTGIVPKTKTTWLSIIPYTLILLIGFVIPMQWGAPAGTVSTLTYSVAITPNVSGEVIDVPVEPNVPLQEGDVLFRIDPTPYQSALDNLTAQLQLAETRLNQAQELLDRNVGSEFDVQTYQGQADSLRAQIDNAQYNLNETVVRAPADGYVTNLALRPGTRAANLPIFTAMVFIDTSDIILGGDVQQIYTRHIEPGQEAEVTFKTHPGKIFSATVEYIIPVNAQGQVQISNTPFQVSSAQAAPFAVRLRLDDEEFQENLIPGSVGSFAIYTSSAKMAHVIRRVMIRMTAIMNYVLPM